MKKFKYKIHLPKPPLKQSSKLQIPINTPNYNHNQNNLKEGITNHIINSPEVRDARAPVSRFVHQKLKPTSRDPRFDPSCGDLNITKFYNSFDFISQLKERELKQLYKVKKGENKQKVIPIIAKAKDELKKRDMQIQSKTITKSLHKAKFHPKKSLIKETVLKEKFDKLQQTGKLDEYMASKRKQISIKIDRAGQRIKK